MRNFISLGISRSQGRPSLSFWNEQKEKIYIPLVIGQDFCVRIGHKRKCMGYRDIGLHISIYCPHQAVMHIGSQCPSCQSRELLYQTTQRLHSMDQASKDYLADVPHRMYLNLRGRDIVKVGVCAEHRKQSRVLEQGAHSTLRIAQADGYDIRELESYISSTYRIPEKVTHKQKIHRLRDIASYDDGHDLLSMHHERIAQDATLLPYICPDPEYLCHTDRYICESLHPSQIYIPDTVGDIMFGGTIVSVVGSIVSVRCESHIYTVDFSLYKGCEIELLHVVLCDTDAYICHQYLYQDSLF